jgi:hypothetical protein
MKAHQHEDGGEVVLWLGLSGGSVSWWWRSFVPVGGSRGWRLG